MPPLSPLFWLLYAAFPAGLVALAFLSYFFSRDEEGP